MHALLKLSGAIDWLNEHIGRWSIWLIFASALISALNAIVRKIFNVSSNAYLEVQWYLFAASFLIAAAFTLLHNEHVRIDVVASRFKRRTQVKMEALGFVFMLIPVCIAVLYYSWSFVVTGYVTGEMSGNSGGLIRWPVYVMIPIGFSLLLLQGISELIKRIAFLQGLIDDPGIKRNTKTAEEELADSIRRLAEGKTTDAAAC